MSVLQHWPLFGLRVRTPVLELSYPNDDDIAEIAERSVTDGVHDSAFMPFTVEWTDVPPPLQQRLSMQFHWGLRANWKPDDWHCNLVAKVDGRLVGTQSASASKFAITRSALTGSFLLKPFQGKGFGTQMRIAILHLLFAGLGAEFAETAAFEDNAQSLGVTAKLGYELQGRRQIASRGRPREMVTFRLSRAAWEAQRRDDVIIEGLQPCLELFGLSDPSSPRRAAQGSTAAAADGSSPHASAHTSSPRSAT